MTRAVVSGRYAGPATRGVAAVIDIGVILGSYTLAVALVDVLSRSVLNLSIHGLTGLPAALILAAWGLVYLTLAVTISGRTVGKAVAGLRVVRRDGSPVRPVEALVRALTLPISIAFLGIGLLMILLQPQHRALHDLLAGTVVVYDWGDRPAELPAPLTAYLRDHDSL